MNHPHSAYVPYLAGSLVLAGGSIGFLKRKSVPSLVSGLVFGGGLLYSGYLISNDNSNGQLTAAALGGLLAVSVLPRVSKGPVPKGLAILGLLVASYHGLTYYRQKY